MSLLIASGAVLIAMAALAFTLLQLGSVQRAGGLYGAAGTLLVSLALLATRDPGLGVAWLRNAERRSDAIAFGVGIPVLAILIGLLAARIIRVRWAQITLVVASLSGAIGAFAAIEIGRSTWYWEFVALVLSGSALLIVATAGLLERAASPNRRVVFGTLAAMGAFTTLGGVLLTAAWASLAV